MAGASFGFLKILANLSTIDRAERLPYASRKLFVQAVADSAQISFPVLSNIFEGGKERKGGKKEKETEKGLFTFL